MPKAGKIVQAGEGTDVGAGKMRAYSPVQTKIAITPYFGAALISPL
jgi:hypothetical protein